MIVSCRHVTNQPHAVLGGPLCCSARFACLLSASRWLGVLSVGWAPCLPRGTRVPAVLTGAPCESLPTSRLPTPAGRAWIHGKCSASRWGFITKGVGAGGPICGALTVQLNPQQAGRAGVPLGPLTSQENPTQAGRVSVCVAVGSGALFVSVLAPTSPSLGPVKSQGRVVLVRLVSLARCEPCGWLGCGAL